jgi:hypothetical protein
MFPQRWFGGKERNAPLQSKSTPDQDLSGSLTTASFATSYHEKIGGIRPKRPQLEFIGVTEALNSGPRFGV